MSGWLIGFAVGAVVVLVVAALLITMIVLARKVAQRAEAILEALIAARDNTQALWVLPETNAAATRIVDAATAAREGLAARGSGS